MFDKLSDEALLKCWRRLQMSGSPVALRLAALEIVARPSLQKDIHRMRAYAELCHLAKTDDEAVANIHKAQEAAIDAGESPAVMLLEELNLRWQLRQPEEWRKVLERIQKNHAKEPGIQEMLVHNLVSIGVLSPDGTPGPLMRAAPPEPAAAAPAPSKLWTPGQPEPAAPAAKSGLWLPGM
jgi:hypothetical protein